MKLLRKTFGVWVSVSILVLISTNCGLLRNEAIQPTLTPTKYNITPQSQSKTTITLEPTNTQAYGIPKIYPILNQVIGLGEEFPEIKLSNYIFDIFASDDDISWSITGEDQLTFQIIEQEMQIGKPSPNWIGSETIRLEACNPGGFCDQTDITFSTIDFSKLTIIHTINAGFLVRKGDRAVLIDSIPNPEYMGRMATNSLLDQITIAAPPFDQVDLILVTHGDHDHFDAAKVASYMTVNTEVVLVSVPQVVQLLLQEAPNLVSRVIEIELASGESQEISVNQFDITAMHYSHGSPRIENIGFLFELDDCKFLHPGDYVINSKALDYLSNLGIPETKLEIAFLPYYLFDQEIIIKEGINANHIVPMHINLESQEAESIIQGALDKYDNLIIFNNPMTWYQPVD